MLTITALDGQTEAISQYNGYEEFEEVNGGFTLTFTSFLTPQNVGHSLITEESIVTTEEGHDFRVKQVITNRTLKKVIAAHTYFDNVENRKYDIYGGTHTFDEFVQWVLADTEWTYRNVDVSESAFIPNFGEDNIVRLIDGLLGAFECEMKIEANKTLTFAKKIGPDNDTQYRYGHNVVAISETIDTTKLRTHIEGYGSNDLHVSYTSPNADIFGIRHADPVYDDRYSHESSMAERLRRELKDIPDVSIEVDAVELQERELGERVWLIYEPLGIEFQTRVMSKKKRKPTAKSTVTLGNSKPASQTDILTETRVEIDENRKEFRSKIEQTNEQIKLEVEEINESIATIELRADTIELSVSSLDNRVGSAEARITINEGQIESKVSQTDYNGNTIASLINQTATTITLEADKINMLGITNVAETLFIGNNYRDTAPKQIWFRGTGGGVVISSETTDNLYIGALDVLTLNAYTLDLSNPNSINWGKNRPVAVWG